MNLSAAVVGEVIWVLGIVAWCIIRYPFERRAKRVPVVSNRRTGSEAVGLAAALAGLAIVPGFYVATGIPEAADYTAHLWAVVIGTILFCAAMWVFRRTHKQLGRNWSITLEIRQQHELICAGPYALVRHPMYTSFLLMGLSQAFLLPNWVAGMAGLIGFAVLFFLRVDKEERMMLEVFGPQYQAYMAKTKRIIPYLY
ncbi:isoprenylcysteine carboxylmethyltransferase family protein [Rhizobium ruizarguesonis]|uniref:Isoprenylcysteine carboxylmethyltransferase family protein n=1 Tax=Rhizobium ruizarguesonis TaxID=2081791 RepID=A0AAE8QF70_9HYPH|nr:protein-S-isoprenylcysteine O-methyltransferase [Rhizobium ruizarguesonis]MBY5802432.1 isoprenylcysteine carboxylmethyltransferase family protein [Rhizobium leguminosarum]NKJ75752.1 isoprenylcysteine carboxylmethyltransferase family protein [Rhizobium leguminosarum bv. viciae]QIO46596.1 isoprenylcysteine carboxylmethyltransferase family protein [Rhizobium leguminosarum bv. trifolii]QJS29077.1 isoprenylcysteine carboxylmethyltransferase family protein [Rhizobium leguminosarum bv. trifolii TA1